MQISGLKINKDKTKVMRIGKSANSDPILCEDLGLKWVSKLKILGIFMTANPTEMKDNLTDKIYNHQALNIRTFSLRRLQRLYNLESCKASDIR